MEYRLKSEQLAQKFDHLFFDIVNLSPLSVMIADDQYKIEYVNHHFLTVTGYQYEEVIGKNPSILRSQLTADAVYHDLYTQLNEIGKWNGQFINVKKNGELYIELATIFVSIDKEQKKHYVAFKQDITEREKLIENAYIDSVSKLYNRRYIDENLPFYVNEAKNLKSSLAIIFMDLDYFKEINDQYGHITGDEAIQTVAQLLRKKIKKGNSWIARYGGDEFIICLPNHDIGDAQRIAKDIRITLKNTEFYIQNNPIHLTCSIGVEALDFDRGIFSAKDLLKIADEKLYLAKMNRTRNKIV